MYNYFNLSAATSSERIKFHHQSTNECNTYLTKNFFNQNFNKMRFFQIKQRVRNGSFNASFVWQLLPSNVSHIYGGEKLKKSIEQLSVHPYTHQKSLIIILNTLKIINPSKILPLIYCKKVSRKTFWNSYFLIHNYSYALTPHCSLSFLMSDEEPFIENENLDRKKSIFLCFRHNV